MTAASTTNLSPEGLLAIWHNVAPGHEVTVRAWYDQEHHAERLQVPGFLSAHRYERRSGQGCKIMNLYRTTSSQVLRSQAYFHCLQNPSERTRIEMPHFRNFSRTVCRLALEMGSTQGEVLAVLAVSDEQKDVNSLLSQMTQAFEAALNSPDVLRCRWIVNEQSALAQSGSAERLLRRGKDEQISWAVVLDVNHDERAMQALELVEARISAVSTTAAIQQRGTYGLVYAGTSS